MLDAIYKLWPASGFPLAGLVLVVPGNLVMPSVSSARGGTGCGGGARVGRRQVWRHQAAAPVAAPVVAAPGLGAARRLLALELQVGGKAHRVDAVFLHRFLVAGGEFGVVFIAGARGVVNVL